VQPAASLFSFLVLRPGTRFFSFNARLLFPPPLRSPSRPRANPPPQLFNCFFFQGLGHFPNVSFIFLYAPRLISHFCPPLFICHLMRPSVFTFLDPSGEWILAPSPRASWAECGTLDGIERIFYWIVAVPTISYQVFFFLILLLARGYELFLSSCITLRVRGASPRPISRHPLAHLFACWFTTPSL